MSQAAHQDCIYIWFTSVARSNQEYFYSSPMDGMLQSITGLPPVVNFALKPANSNMKK